jgi:transcription initiation factor IIE alpha subunit
MKKIELWECGNDGARIPFGHQLMLLPKCPFCGVYMEKVDDSTVSTIKKLIGRGIVSLLGLLRNKNLEEWK